MKKMQVVLDREKVIREGIYDINRMQHVVDEVFVDENGLIKGDEGYYYAREPDGALERFMTATFTLSESDWLLDNVKTWIWYNSDDYPEEDCTEDAKEFFLRCREERRRHESRKRAS